MTRLLSTIDPDRQERFARRALGADRGGGELDLLVGHALDRNLAGGAAADRGDDGQAVRADRDIAMGGRLGPRAGLPLLLQRREASFQSSWSCPCRNRSGSGSTSGTSPLSLSDVGRFGGDLGQADLAAGHRGGEAVGLVRDDERIGRFVIELRALDQQVHRVVELGGQRGRDGADHRAVEHDARVGDADDVAQR